MIHHFLTLNPTLGHHLPYTLPMPLLTLISWIWQFVIFLLILCHRIFCVIYKKFVSYLPYSTPYRTPYFDDFTEIPHFISDDINSQSKNFIIHHLFQTFKTQIWTPLTLHLSDTLTLISRKLHTRNSVSFFAHPHFVITKNILFIL